MKKVCGIDLKGSEAIIVALEGTPDNYSVISVPYTKIQLHDHKVASEIRSLHQTLSSFFKEMNFDEIGVKGRRTKGKGLFIGGPVSFKIEGIIQLLDPNVNIIDPKTLSAKLKNFNIDSSGTKKYQSEALKVALFLLH